MQKDFHFYAVYVLCRGAGIKPDLAKRIAYASQYVDDAKFGEAISFSNGGRFQQEMTAHELIEVDTLKPETQYRIFSAFHFLPGNAQDLPRVSSPEPKFRERMICTPDSSVSQELLEHVKRISNREFFPQAIGIALHVYADTFAHQDFSGLCMDFPGHGLINDADGLKVWDDESMSFEPYAPGRGIFSKAMGLLGNTTNWLVNSFEMVKLGHAQVFTLPDEPYRRWKYRHVYYGLTLERNNPDIFLEASQKIHSFLASSAIRIGLPEAQLEQPIPWDSLKGSLRDAFSQFKGTEAERCGKWLEAIRHGSFGIEEDGDRNLSLYDDKVWFEVAVYCRARFFKCWANLGKFLGKVWVVRKIVKNKWFYSYEWRDKEAFKQSDWKRFHDAAVWHRFTVLNRIMSDRGMICG